MKYYIIVAITNKNLDVGVMSGKNKKDVIRRCRSRCIYDQYVPVKVKRISKSYFYFISSLSNA